MIMVVLIFFSVYCSCVLEMDKEYVNKVTQVIRGNIV